MEDEQTIGTAEGAEILLVMMTWSKGSATSASSAVLWGNFLNEKRI